MPQYVVKASFDHDADVWRVKDTNVPGLSTEAATFEAFCRKIEVKVPELLAANGTEKGRFQNLNQLKNSKQKRRIHYTLSTKAR